MFIPFIRTIILYFFVVVAMRLMGKRQIGEMQPTELVITILISAVASVPMQDLDVPLSFGVIPIFTLILAEIFISFLTLKFPTIRELLTGRPVVVIENGQINQKALCDIRFSIEDLQEDLRLKDIYDIRQIRRAQLETNGELSILLKEEFQPVTHQSLNLPAPIETLYLTVITDGFIHKKNLSDWGIDVTWLEYQLKLKGFDSVKDVFFMFIDSNFNTIIYRKERK